MTKFDVDPPERGAAIAHREAAAGPANAFVTESGRPDGLPLPRRYVAIVALSLGTVLTSADSTMINIALPSVARDLHVQPSEVVLAVTIYQLVLLMTLLPFGALGERIGLRRLYQSGQIVFLIASGLCFFANNLTALIIVRIFQAVGAAATLSMVPAMVRAIYPKATLGRGLSVSTVMAASTAAMAPTLGGLILSHARWPWLFAILVPFGIVSVFLGRNSLPTPPVRTEPFDLKGSIMCASVFGVGTFGLNMAVHGDSVVISALLIAITIAGGFVVVRRELHQPYPIFPVDLLRNRVIGLSAAGSLAANVAAIGITLLVALRTQQEFGFTPAQSGTALAPWPLMMLVFAPVAGSLSDRIPAGILGGIGMFIAVGGIATMAFLPAHPTTIDVAWRVGLCGIGFGVYLAPNGRQLLNFAPHHRTASAGSLLYTITGAGRTLGSTAVAALIASGLTLGPSSAVMSGILCLFAALCSFCALQHRLRAGPGLD